MLGAEAALHGLLLFCPLALGSAPTWTLWPLTLLSSAALVLACLASHRQQVRVRVHLVGWPLVVGAFLCLFQLVPLPQGVLKLLSPLAAELRDFALVPLGLERARPVSLEPSGTWREVAKYLSYLAVFVAATQVARSRRARRRLLGVLAMSGGVVALMGYGHHLLGAGALWGLYRFRHATPPLLTPFGNPNHLAGFLLLASTLAMGLFLGERRQERSWAFGGVFLASGGALLLSLSRAGIFFFVVALALLGVLVLVFRPPVARGTKHGPAPRAGFRPAAWVLVGAMGVGALGLYLGFERLFAELSSVGTLEKLRASKLELWAFAAAAALRFWVAGMGRGAFQVGFTPFQEVMPGNLVSHPENLVLQLWAEFGVAGAALVVGLSLRGFFRLLGRSWRSSLDFAALSGVVALTLHNLFDFNLELPACAVALWVVLGVLARREPSETAPEGGPQRLREELRVPGGLGAALGAGLLGVGLLGLVAGRHTLEDAEAELNAAVTAGANPAEVHRVALALIDRHPADYLLYSIAGRALAGVREDSGQALAFVNRALYLRPLDVEAHRTAARALLRLGRRPQAFLEYRLAASGVEPQGILDEAVRAARTTDELIALVPRSPLRVCEVATRLRMAGRGEQAGELLRWGMEELAQGLDAGRMWVDLASLQLARGAHAAALQTLAQAESRAPEDARIVLLRAEALWGMGQREEALALLEARIVQQPGSVELSFALALRLLEAGVPLRALEVLTRASPFVPPAQRSQLLELRGRTFERLGRPLKALEVYLSAARLSPEQPRRHYEVARLYEQLGRLTDAIEAIREGMRHDTPAGAEASRAWVQRLLEKEKSRDKERRRRAASTPEDAEIERLLEGLDDAKPAATPRDAGR